MTATSEMLASHERVHERGQKFLTFRLAEEEYGITINRVNQIIPLQKITPYPQADPSVEGVINLRGRILPVINLRHRFKLPARSPGARTCIIVVTAGKELAGLLADEVSEVLDIEPLQMEPPPKTGDFSESSVIQLLAKIGDSVKMILDLDQVVEETPHE